MVNLETEEEQELREKFRKASQTASRNLIGHAKTLPAAFFQLPNGLPNDAFRGALDRRALAFEGLTSEQILEATPRNENSLAAWLAFMDVFGEVRKSDAMDGVAANMRAYRKVILEQRFKMKEYDTAASIIAWNHFRKRIPDFDARFPEVAQKLDIGTVNKATIQSPLHGIMDMRLEKDADLLDLTQDDLAAFAFRIAKLIKDDLVDGSFDLVNLEIPEWLRSKGFDSPKSFFEKEEKLKELRANLKQLNHDRNEFLGTKGSGGGNRRKRKKRLRRQVNELFNEKIAQTADEAKNLKTDINDYRKFMEARKFDLGKEIGGKEVDLSVGLIKHSENLGDFSYYKISPNALRYTPLAQDLITAEKAQIFLDGLYKDYGKEFQRANNVGRKLSAHLMAPRAMHLQRELEDGQLLDPGTLTRIVMDPFHGAPYMALKESAGRELNTGTTLLLDNSGSMRGDKIILTFIAAERISHWLNLAGYPTEILGFTTKGNVQGKPNQRRDNLQHITYKKFEEPHSERTTLNMAAMLNHELQMSNIDSEAVAWAHNRLINTSYKRKILIVLSDGNPQGSVDHNILKQHLRDTVAWIEEKSPVEIIGIGIKTDVGQFYTNSIRIDSPYELLETMAEKLKETLDDPMQSSARLRRRRGSILTPYTTQPIFRSE